MTINDVLDTVLKLNEIIVEFDTVQRTIYKRSNQAFNALRFKKKFTDGTYYAVELLYKQNRLLKTQTIYMAKVDFMTKQKSR